MPEPTNPPPAEEDPFGPDSDGRVPGELIVTLSADANQTATTTVSAAGTSASGEPAAAPTSFGVASVDQALAALQPQSISKIHEEVGPSGTAAGSTSSVDPTLVGRLAATYLVAFNPEIDPTAVIQQLTALPEVVDAEPNFYASSTFVPNDTDWSQQWGPVAIHCPEAWDTSTGSSAITVAIVDSGVDLNHVDLSSQLVTGANFVDIRSAAPRGFHYEGRITPDNNAQDEVGHGTHVAGIVGALGNNSQGVAGVVWQCKLLPVRVMARIVRDSTGAASGSGTSANIAAGIRWAADQGAQVINLSLGGYGASRVEANAVAYAQACGSLVVAAMGNDNTSRPLYPAAFPDVVAVGSIGPTDQRSSFSNTGSHMVVCGPGEAIHNTYYDYPNRSSTYADLSGTSMATPHVSGVAALVWSSAPGKTATAVKNVLTSTARALPVTDPTQYGAGCIDAAASLRAVVPQVISGPDPETQPMPPDPVAVAGTDQGTPTA